MTHTTPQKQTASATPMKTTAKTHPNNQKTPYQTISKLWELRFRQ